MLDTVLPEVSISKPSLRRMLPYAEDTKNESHMHRNLERDLRQAVAQNNFTWFYQPRIRCDRGHIVGAEALARWTHRRRGMLSPAYFIPLAEKIGVITQLGALGLRMACVEAMRWANPDSFVSVNISARQLTDRVLLSQVAVALEQSGLNPERLELELTESSLLEMDDDILLTLAALRDRGVGLALDDFGTGYASLGMLRRLPLTVLKVDRSLIRNLPDDREDVAIMRAAVQAGQAMGLRVVAEGVETMAQHDFLVAIGCDETQGFLYARPMPAEQIRARML